MSKQSVDFRPPIRTCKCGKPGGFYARRVGPCREYSYTNYPRGWGRRYPDGRKVICNPGGGFCRGCAMREAKLRNENDPLRGTEAYAGNYKGAAV